MPVMMSESWHSVVAQTLPTSSFAPGATPRYLPPDAAPLPTMVDATWVPWPTASPGSLPPVKSRTSVRCPAKSGWLASIPVSSTPTVTPVPSKPACQAAGAPICGTLRSRETLRLPSSQMWVTPGGEGARGGRPAGQRGPERHPVVPARPDRERVGGRQVGPHPPVTADGRGPCLRRLVLGVRDQQRQLGCPVVVAELAERGEVEQPPVEPTVAQQWHRVDRDDVLVTVLPTAHEPHAGPSLRPLDVRPPVRVERHPVTGDQGEGAGSAGAGGRRPLLRARRLGRQACRDQRGREYAGCQGASLPSSHIVLSATGLSRDGTMTPGQVVRLITML